MSRSRARACPCGSGADLRACCEPLHRGGEPAGPVELVRSRFAAFALGEGAYLVRTLHPDHPLRAQPEGELVRELSAAHRALRYRALLVHDVELDDARARVLFTVRLFERGQDRSFVELSRFERTAEGWRYLGGRLWPAGELAERTLGAIDAAGPPRALGSLPRGRAERG